MDKVICDVCGTQYPENAEQCPICGCARASGAATVYDDVVTDEAMARPAARVKGGRFSKENVQKRNQGVELPEARPAQRAKDVTRRKAPEPAVMEEQSAGQKKDVIINVLLVIVILALLAVGGFIIKEFLIPGQPAPTTAPTTEAPTTAPVPSTEETTTIPTVPCTDLSVPEEEVMLYAPGQAWLLNVTVLPEDTTDELTYISMDEQVAAVNSEGRITAVGEGETEILIACGEQEIRYKVICNFEISQGETSEQDTTETTAPLKDVTLKVNLTDITFGDKGLGYTFKCEGLSNEEVTWVSEDENIVTVDKGFALAVGRGTTHIIAQYGDQKVSIIVRCAF